MRHSNFSGVFSIATIFLLFILLSACKGPKARVIKSPPNYNFSQAQTIKLDLKLKEISGLAWDADKDEFLAHYDESGKLFVLDKSTLQIKPPSPFAFGGKGDYEDVAMYDGVPFVLRSDGVITKIIRDSLSVQAVDMGKLPLAGGINDFETLYADTARKALIMVCKNCDMDSKSVVSAFAFYPDSIGYDIKPVFRINADSIKAIAARNGHKKTSKFQPSAASIHPVWNKLVIISSASSQLVIADLNGNPEKVFELGQKLFPQPEGLTFKRNGDMYISNEGVTSSAKVHRFAYKP
jgi:SdiA-regulated